MPLLARHIRQPAAWAEIDEEAAWAENDFPYAPLSDLADARSKGLSCYQVARRNDPILRRLAASLFIHGDHRELKPMQFRFMDTVILQGMGLTIQQSPSSLPDNALNGLHYDLTGATGPKAIELIRQMKGRIRIVSESEIVREIVNGLRAGRLSKSDIKGNVVKILGDHLIKTSLPTPITAALSASSAASSHA